MGRGRGRGKIHSYPSFSSYVKLDVSAGGSRDDRTGTPKGCVPVLVGKDDDSMERFHVPTKLMEHPYIVDLLEMSAREFGYNQKGLIKIEFEAECFKQMVKRISKERR